MITLDEAIGIVEQELARMESSGSPSMSILMDRIIEKEFGWIFFYNSTDYLTTGNPSSQLAGNGPLVVERKDGKMHHTGTSDPLDVYIQKIFNR